MSSMLDIMKKMKQVNEPGLRDPKVVAQEHKLPTEDGKMSMYDIQRAYNKVEGTVVEEQQDKKEETLKNIILEDKDRLRTIGALQLVKEQVDKDLMKEEEPQKILENIHKIIKTFYT